VRSPFCVLTALVFGLALALLPGPVEAASPLPSPAVWPLPGGGDVTRRFDPPAERWNAGHRGVDLAATPGQSVVTTAAGTVVFAGRVAGRPVVVVDHGGVRTTYEPVRASVRRGQRVSAGAVIGVVARGGHCDGHCLHWGLRRGETYLDPLSLLDGEDDDGIAQLRLVSEAQRAAAIRAARERAEAAARAVAAGPDGIITAISRPGSHGFSRPVPGGITSPYGMRFHPVLRRWKLHDGTDFGAACGTTIRAPYAGTVTRRFFNAGYGNRLFLDHGRVDGLSVQTAYNHATRYVVRPGEHVRRGQVIGYVGTTGFSTGCHLHLMVWLNGRMVNPMVWF
jgi:murein DD-endopeptidase MepM/ murein hydrolase activator NlpD